MTGPAFVEAGGHRLALWQQGGQASLPAIFFAHATGFHARCWDQIIARLPDRHCYALDILGHGQSDKPAPPYRWRWFGEQVASVCRQLEVRDMVGVGHSMGGHAITLAAALAPECFRSLLLIDPVIRPESQYAGPWIESHFARKRRNHWSSPDEMFERFRDRDPFRAWDPQVLRDYCDYGLRREGDAFVLACPPEIEGAIYEQSSVPQSNIYPELRTVEIPVTVLRSAREFVPGTPDMSASPTASDLATHFRKGRDVCTRYSHFIPMEAPSLIADMVAGATPQTFA